MSTDDHVRRIRITASDQGGAVIEVDGRDVAGAVEAYRLTQTVEKGPELTLYMRPGWQGLAYEGVGEVLTEPADLRHVVIDFLDAVDWQRLDDAVLARDDLDGKPGELTRGMLAQLREWAARA
ncbi:hypothetical protein [Streptomyces sp. NPDC047968]|uniref:hypothetical protein n=1 Tax=unclassified Streptomyces TaxID=2593676 RepID=UPI0034403A70